MSGTTPAGKGLLTEYGAVGVARAAGKAGIEAAAIENRVARAAAVERNGIWIVVPVCGIPVGDEENPSLFSPALLTISAWPK